MWMLLLLIAVAPIVFLAMKLDQLNKMQNRLKVQLHFAEQQSVQLEHLAFWLAEAQSQQLLAKVQQVGRAHTKAPVWYLHTELLCKAIPVLCKEQANHSTLPRQAVAKFLKQQNQLSFNEMENFIRHHPVLTEFWQSNTLTSYLKMCQRAVDMLQEYQPVHSDRLAG
ncbi:MAG: hypothetical protein KJ556_01225 [Gammaproteobacteria bacterium]|nr:hypothetical protein [Gammaproteobacteria bacterium]MBU2059176.1 hypothetical protein [Gammaproteobacteria bacterium]MBU2173727.1 hypothetical protein [Gammaproteobacteria bacterium]MBU2246883.1 hypothetical protein [Gammaproteobacteria bacterium]MBU2343453.1 hypothetical protein [Gammaproteobacteria bacterium]